MSSTPMYHPDDDETNPRPEDQGTARSHERNSEDQVDQAGGDTTRSSRDDASGTTDLDELNDDGVGGTIGSKDTFEPEEIDESHGSGTGDSAQE